MGNPSHPGKLLCHEVTEDLSLSAIKAAERFAMSQATRSRVLNDMAAISSDHAVWLEQVGASRAQA